MFGFLAGYRTKLGVVASIIAGLGLFFEGLSDQLQGNTGWTKMFVGLFGIGTGLTAAGIRWAPQFVGLIEEMKLIAVQLHLLKEDTTKIKEVAVDTNIKVVEVVNKEKSALGGSLR